MPTRNIPLSISKDQFKKVGHELVDRIAEFHESIDGRPVTAGESSLQLQDILGQSPLPENGKPVDEIIKRATELLFNHSLLNGHPKFFGYITSSPAPIGALADLLVAAVNPNVGANILSPVATEIEKQTVRWIAEFIGVSPDCGGLLVSGGNMANFTAFLAGRNAKASKNFKEDGAASQQMLVYCSKATHTWIEKAAVLFGLGTKAVRWIETDVTNKINIRSLEENIKSDLENGLKPFMVIGTAGDVSTGAVDDLKSIGAICKKYDLWFHVDGAYGIPAAILPELKNMFAGIEDADSIAVDPHKWLYSPLDAGCTLVKNPKHLTDTFSSHPVYYNFDNEPQTLNYFEYGMENSRSFRALKVWLALQQIGRSGYMEMISDDIELSKLLFKLANDHPELEAVTQSLSITTLRYVPAGVNPDDQKYLNTLNESLLNELQKGGKVFLSNAVVKEKYCLRVCIVNFRTTATDIVEVVHIIADEAKRIHSKLQAEGKN